MKKQYKEFNLSKLSGAQVETRDGRKVKYVHLINDTNNPRPLIGVVESEDELYDDIINFTETGRFWDTKNDSSLDLFIVEEVKTYYVNVYKLEDGRLHLSGIAYETREKALDCAGAPTRSKYLKTIEVTDEVEETTDELDGAKLFDSFSSVMEYLLTNCK